MKKGLNTRGLSEIIISLIMILLVLVAIGIVWVVTRNIITESSEQVTIDPLTNNIKIEDAKIGLLTAQVKVTRTTGNANITSLQFIFGEGANSYTYEQKTDLPNPMESKTYTINLSNGVKPGTKIIVIPIFGKITGLEDSITSTADLTSTMNNGLVAYYKFEGDAKDSSGNGNDGFCSEINCPSFIEGKIEQGASFNGNNITISKKDTLSPQQFTLSAWIKWNGIRAGGSSDFATIISKGKYNGGEYTLLFYRGTSYPTSTKLNFYINNEQRTAWANSIIDTNWHLITATYDGSKASIYFDDQGLKSSALYSSAITPTTNDITIGSQSGASPLDPYYWEGLLDEFTIFNRSLTDSEIKQIYLSQK